MHNHFSQYLNLKSFILEKRPKVIVECGAGSGELTRKICSLWNIYDFDFHVISDTPVPGLDPKIKWVQGLSYDALKIFPNETIDLCIIDTDHNYWTLAKELQAVVSKIKEGGLIALHDVETFYHDTGMALSYSSGETYPREEIERMASLGGLGDALIAFLNSERLGWKLLAFNRESHGAAVIEKRTQTHYSLFLPGSGAVYANPVENENSEKEVLSIANL